MSRQMKIKRLWIIRISESVSYNLIHSLSHTSISMNTHKMSINMLVIIGTGLWILVNMNCQKQNLLSKTVILGVRNYMRYTSTKVKTLLYMNGVANLN